MKYDLINLSCNVKGVFDKKEYITITGFYGPKVDAAN
jgi:hypothetical protein